MRDTTLAARGTLADDDSALDGVMAGINILGEKLQAKVADAEQAQQALAESEAMIEDDCDAILDGIFVVEAQTQQHRMVNDTICRMLGYSREEWLTMSVEDVHPRKELPDIARKFEKVVGDGSGFVTSIPMLRKDGTVFYADLNSSPLTINGVACVVGVFRDITERKLADQTASDERNFSDTWIASQPDIFYVLDLTGRFVRWNDRLRDVLGYSDSPIAETNALDIIYEADRPAGKRNNRGLTTTAALPMSPSECYVHPRRGRRSSRGPDGSDDCDGIRIGQVAWDATSCHRVGKGSLQPIALTEQVPDFENGARKGGNLHGIAAPERQASSVLAI